MSLLIKKAKIIHPDSSYNGEVKDMLVQNGKIIRIADEIKDEKATVISSAKLHASIGWMDIGTVSGEPGYEQRETFESLSKTAAAGVQARINQRQSLPLLQTSDGLYPRFMLEQTVEFHPQTGRERRWGRGC